MRNIIILAVFMSVPAHAGTRQVYGPLGQYQGMVIDNGHSQQYYGPTGGYQGQSIDTGSSRQYYGPTGGYEGMETGRNRW